MTIENGQPPSYEKASTASQGAGIYNQGTLALSNCIVSGNTGSSGGIFNSGTLTITNSTVSGNTETSGGSGGGIVNDDAGTLILVNTRVSGNTPDGVSNFGTLTISGNSAVSSNTGRGIENNGGTLTIANSTVSDNTQGGIYNLIGTLTVINSTVSDNTGRGINNNGGKLTITKSTVSDNKSTVSGTIGSGDGGGILNSWGMLTLLNSTVSGNRVADLDGGGILNWGGTVHITYSTIYSNRAKAGGGIANEPIAPLHGSKVTGTVLMEASIVAGDTADQDPDVLGPITLLYTNLIENIHGATIDFGTDPLYPAANTLAKHSIFDKPPQLGPLEDNPGPVQPHTWTHALRAGSPAINAIPYGADNPLCGGSALPSGFDQEVSTDQRDIARPEENACDLGAYEHKPSQ